MDIGPPPEFGSDGSPPPLTSVPISIADWSLNKSVKQFLWPGVDGPYPGLIRALDLSVKAATRPAVEVIINNFRRHRAKSASRKNIDEEAAEMRWTSFLRELDNSHLTLHDVTGWQTHALHDQFWQREDPVTQLSPGSTSEITMSLRTGISQERATELARSLGVKGTMPYVGISAALSDKASSKIVVSQEREVIRKITLTNPRDHTYRRLAIWHVVHRISIVAVHPRPPSNEKITCEENEFILSDATNVTFMDVDSP